MTGLGYEHACAEYFRKQRYSDVQVTKASGDQGIEVIAVKDGKNTEFSANTINHP